MKKLLLALSACAALGAFSTACLAQPKNELQIEKPWARATVPGAAVGGGYLTIRNNGAASDRLIGAASPAAARVEMHTMAMEKDVMRMREVKGVDVPAKGAVQFKPGGYHLMLIDLKAPLRQGDKVPVTLRFEKAGEVRTELSVEPQASAAGHSMKH
jgi:copper(I)-binding protein